MAVHIDFETYSEADLKKVGAWAYAAHPSTEVICMAYYADYRRPMAPKIGVGFLKDTADITKLLSEIVAGAKAKYKLHAWNAFFEMAICYHVLGIKEAINPQLWHDTAADAAALSLPRSLGECTTALGLPSDKQKDKRGKYLIQRLCKPNRGKRIEDPELLQELYDYCQQDVIAEHAVSEQIKTLSKNERKVWELDQTINARGVPIDTESIKHALSIRTQETERLNSIVGQITGGALVNTNQRAKVIEYIKNATGYTLENYKSKYLSKVVDDPKLPSLAREIIGIRQQAGKTSLAKYESFARTDVRSRVHGMLMYHGASTGRWTGRLVQLQNLPRPTIDDTDEAVTLFEHRDSELIGMVYDNTMEVLSSCVRSMIKAPEGKKLIVADYSAIEARVLPWLSGQEDVLDVFRGGKDIYKYTAAQIYKTSYEQVDKDQRFIGKVATLALGYQGGEAAFRDMAADYGVDIDAALADKVKEDWRTANDKTTRYWYNINDAAIRAVRTTGKTYKVNNIQFRVVKDFLHCRLPSGRMLSYYKPEIGVNRFGKDAVTFMGTDTYTRKWCRCNTYGGKLVENITQAVARDLMAEAMLRLEDAGYPIVLTVHDEIIVESDIDKGSVEEMIAIMCQLPDWAKGLPVEADGYESQRYRK